MKVKKNFLKQNNMRRFKHKPSGKIFQEGECDCYILDGHQSIPRYIVESGNDWEEMKEPVFITEDGVAFHSSDVHVYAVHIRNWTSFRVKILSTSFFQNANHYGWKYFSTEEARLDYIVNHRPCLNFIDIRNALSIYGMSPTSSIYRIIEEAIKEKLKANDSNL